MTDQAAAEMGDNHPETDVDPLLARLREDHADLLTRRAELLGGISRAPDAVDSEQTAGNMADFDEQLKKFLKSAKIAHESEKAPFLVAGRTVDGFLHSLVDDVTAGRARLNVVRKKYADEKAAAERRRREEEARIAREESERLAREAAERAAAMSQPEDLDEAVRAEDAATQARLDAEQAQKDAEAKPAEMGKSRGDYGGQTSLKQFWDFADIDRATLDLNALRQHLPEDALDKALRSFIKAGGREISGARIFENTRL
jgi:multidrug efflux pump subunit AcrA (membrane-fusion protein)